ncbi:acetyl-CoA synthetase-like protein [Aspergillus saccharolyticus JOP 1030-1]|uniref:Acetyl-CoA synthetase-like protein n=1 Tax=Aspergillus saccharolyticus JOP 1030-1 TaxID=1450539 RepID=A0A319A484_9EURO|nr:acetyl-CoA synthetase-like protein [Aspergillus saccharolyticus JOP 1030-1]PYH42242.1 acetyl-CoA synthetase-like protein [Aspergillus saccharolyticus JOP 1030-1]
MAKEQQTIVPDIPASAEGIKRIGPSNREGESTSPPQIYTQSTAESIEHAFSIPSTHTRSNVPTVLRLAWAVVLAAYQNLSEVSYTTNLAESEGNAAGGSKQGIEGCHQLAVHVEEDKSVVELLNNVQSSCSMRLGLILPDDPGAIPVGQWRSLLSIGEVGEAIRNAPAGFQIQLTCHPTPSAITVRAHIDEGQFESEMMRMMLYQLAWTTQQILEGCSSVKKLKIISPEGLQLLQTWNATTPAPVNTCVHEMILSHCVSTPDHSAVCAWDGRLTYKDLDDLSQRVASHLVARGAGPERFIPVLLEKSLWTPVAILGILRAGSAFLLLDPRVPTSRLLSQCHDVGATIVLTSPGLSHIAAALELDAVFLSNAQINTWFDGGKATTRLPSCHPHQALYAVFTSGSTGQPKGVVIQHFSFCTSAKNFAAITKIDQSSRVFQFSTYSFDVSISDHLVPLMHGACLCIPSATQSQNSLAQSIRDLGANWIDLTPSVSRILSSADLAGVTTLNLGGEAMMKSDVERWADLLRLVNSYGPSECSVTASSRVMRQASDSQNIGFVTGGVGWVVYPDDESELVPLGAIGELVIEGPIVGRGYLAHGEGFTDSLPWLRELRHGPMVRAYKTGDLVQQLSDGSFRYVGRKDTQVKLRGQRIELGEVEHHVSEALANIQSAVAEVVHLRKDDSSQAILVIFIQCQCGTLDGGIRPEQGDCAILPPSACFQRDIKKAVETLRKRLPAYLVPSVFFEVNFIPLSSSGKVDRKLLRAMAANLGPDGLHKYRCREESGKATATLPKSRIANKLQTICSELLNTPVGRVPLDESFISLGGDSITAMVLVARCNRQQIQVTVQDILHATSLRELAFSATEIEAPQQDTLVQVGVSFPLAPIQQLFFDILPAGHNHYNQSFLLQIQKPVRVEDVATAIQSLVERHPMLRARFYRDGGGRWAQLVTQDVQGSYHFSHIHLDQLDEASQHIGRSQKSLDICHGPLFSAILFDVGHHTQYLFLVAHHLVVDLVSWRMIFADVENYLTGKSPSPIPSMPFDRWCTLQDQYIRENLKEVEPVANNPGSCNLMEYWGLANCSNNYADTARVELSVDVATTRLLLGKANEALRTRPVEIIQSALLFSFMQVFSDRAPPLIYSEGHGREPWDNTGPPINISQTVGWFTTFWPTAASAQRDHSFIEVLERVKDARRQMPRKGWSFFSSRAGQFTQELPMEILFNYHGSYQELESETAVLRHVNEISYRWQDVRGDAPRTELFEVTGFVDQKRLNIEILYNNQMPRSPIEKWTAAIESSLLEVSRMLISTPVRFTLSDFSLLETGYQELEDLITSLNLEDITMIEDIYPCLGLQKDILLSQAKNPTAYVTTATWEFRHQQTIDISRFEQAWLEVVQTTPVLRTVFAEDTRGKQWVQVVLRNMAGAVSVLPETGRCTANSAEMMINQHRQPLTTSMPWQLLVVPTGTHTLVCHLAISHALVDGHSMLLLPDQLTTAYTGGLLHNRSSMADFWAGYIDGSSPCLFPGRGDGDGIRSTSNANTVEFVLADPAMQSLCEQYQVTLFNLVQVAWGLVLRAYTGSEVVQFGFLVSSRTELIEGFEAAVGPYINMLLCRMDLASSREIKDVLQETRASTLQALRYQHTSLADLCSSLQVERHELFNTGISFQPHEKTQGRASNLTWAVVGEEDPTDFDISINVIGDADQLRVKLSYYSSFISDSQASSLAATFEKVLQTVARSPGLAIKNTEILTDNEIAQLEHWNGVLPRAEECCIHEVIAKHCRDSPLAPAIDAWDGLLSYAALDDFSSRLANALVAHSCPIKETIIPILTQKSKWTAVAMVAILRAGATFVLLDPSYPFARLQMICHKVNAAVLVSSSADCALATQLCETVIIVGDREVQTWPCTHLLNSMRPTPKTAAYVVFTSGSTGEPKGVIIEHSAFCTSARAQKETLSLDTQSRVLQFASYAFDVSIADHLTTLIAGACICVPSSEEVANALMPSIERYQVNWMALTPSVVRTLDPSDVRLRTLKTLVIGGEPMSRRDMMTWMSAKPQLSLYVAYGPAECSVMVTSSRMMRDMCVDSRNIGHAPTAALWITDPHDYTKLQPIGAVGELLVEGPILGQGYLNDPRRTSMSFVQSPPWLSRYRTSAAAPSRLYRTGDLVQYQSNGSVRYCGRKDNQIKLRGQRIEPGEVEEQTLRAFDDAELVIVDIVLLGGNDGDRHASLVAFVSFQDDMGCSTRGEAAFAEPTPTFRDAVTAAVTKLRSRIPRYMIPAYFLPLQRVPLTKSGKYDRQGLRRQAETLTQEDLTAYLRAGTASSQLPRTRREQQLQKLYGLVLKVDREKIGLNDDFFHLGGDSIKAMELVAQARAEGLSLHVAEVFQNPTLGSLSAVTTLSSSPSSKARALEAGDSQTVTQTAAAEPLHLRRMWINNQEYEVADVTPATECQSNEACGPMPYFVLELPEQIDAVKLAEACTSWMQVHPILRTVFVQWGGQILQVVLQTPPVTLLPGDTLPDSAKDPVSVALSWCYQDVLARPPLGTPYLALKLVRGIGTSHALALRLNHAQYDGICFPKLIQDLLDIYQGREIEKIPEFSAYSRYATQQVIHNQDALQFWTQLLDGARMNPVYRPPDQEKSLCADHALPTATTTARVLHSTRTIGVPTPPAGITMATVIKASWASVLWRLQLTEDVTFGQISSGRSTGVPGLDQVVGHCLVEVPVRVRIDPRGCAMDLFHQIQVQQIQSMRYELLGLRQIVEKCTSWPCDIYFGSLLHHKSRPDKMEFSSGDLTCRVVEEAPDVVYRYPFVAVDSVEDCAGSILLDLWAKSDVATQASLDRLSRVLGVTIARFLSAPGEAVENLTAGLAK